MLADLPQRQRGEEHAGEAQVPEDFGRRRRFWPAIMRRNGGGAEGVRLGQVLFRFVDSRFVCVSCTSSTYMYGMFCISKWQIVGGTYFNVMYFGTVPYFAGCFVYFLLLLAISSIFLGCLCRTNLVRWRVLGPFLMTYNTADPAYHVPKNEESVVDQATCGDLPETFCPSGSGLRRVVMCPSAVDVGVRRECQCFFLATTCTPRKNIYILCLFFNQAFNILLY